MSLDCKPSVQSYYLSQVSEAGAGQAGYGTGLFDLANWKYH